MYTHALVDFARQTMENETIVVGGPASDCGGSIEDGRLCRRAEPKVVISQVASATCNGIIGWDGWKLYQEGPVAAMLPLEEFNSRL